MSFTLTTDDGKTCHVNAWNWGVLHERVARAGLFDSQTTELLRHNCGVRLSSEDVARLAGFLEDEVQPLLRPGERLFYDDSVTSVPDDGTFFRDDLGKNYSLQYEVLREIIEFLRAAGGPVEIG